MLHNIKRGDTVVLRLNKDINPEDATKTVHRVRIISKNELLIEFVGLEGKGFSYYLNGRRDIANSSIMDIVDINPQYFQDLQEVVQISIPHYRFESSSYIRFIMQCFNIDRSELPYDYRKKSKVTIICTKEQFCKFIYQRNLLGINNLIKELDMELISVRYTSNVINVVGR